VFITMAAAVMTGAGFVGQGMMFVNQAAGSAILVVALHKHGTGPERAIDALIGGAVALVLGVLLLPAEPRRLLAKAEGAVLSTLAAALAMTARILERGAEPQLTWALETGHEVHLLLADLAAARSTARTAVRIAPRRWSSRAAVDAESDRTAYVDLLANAVLSLQRAATRTPIGGSSVDLAREIGALGSVIGQLAGVSGRGPKRCWGRSEQLPRVRSSARTGCKLRVPEWSRRSWPRRRSTFSWWPTSAPMIRTGQKPAS
jgi:hypothetical protein